MGQEVELKLLLTPVDAERIVADPDLCRLSGGKPDTLALANTYFDTPDGALHRHRMALRIREQSGQFIQTLKTRGVQVGGLYQRGEWEWPVPRNRLETDLLTLDSWPTSISVQALAPVFRTDFTRTVWMVEWNSSCIELVVDQGAVIAGTHHQPISELELELKSGEAGSLFEFARELATRWPLHVSPTSKAEQGYRLAGIVSESTDLASALDLAPALDSTADFHEMFVIQITYALDQWQRGWSDYLQTQNRARLLQSYRGALRLGMLLDMMPGTLSPMLTRRLKDSLQEEASMLGQITGLIEADTQLRGEDSLLDQCVKKKLADYQRSTRAGEIALVLGEQLWIMNQSGS